MRKLQQLLGRLRRGVRRRWEDWRTGTLTCWGGPLDGVRRDANWATCRRVRDGAWTASFGMLGIYARRPGEKRWMWEQYARNEVTRPPDYPHPDPESWS